MTSAPTRFTTSVGPEDASERLDRFLSRRFPKVSRARFQDVIANGGVAVEGTVVRQPRRKVKAGEQVKVELPPAVPPEPKPEAIPLAIIFEDQELVVIDKPAGLVVHPSAGHETGTLVNALIAHCGASLSGIGGVRRPGIVHRLDKDTSGLLVIAKTDEAHRGLSEQFAAHGRDGRLRREYLAIVWGVPEKRRGRITAPLRRSSANRKKIAVSKARDAREAVTHYEVIEAYGNPPVASLLRLGLETGRTHQIRVHLAHIGHPLLGDPTYGRGFSASVSKLSEAAKGALAALGRQALHAGVLGFEHPITHIKMLLESELPLDIAVLREKLGDRAHPKEIIK